MMVAWVGKEKGEAGARVQYAAIKKIGRGRSLRISDSCWLDIGNVSSLEDARESAPIRSSRRPYNVSHPSP